MTAPSRLRHVYAPRGTCRAIFDGPHARAPELLVSGPAGTGKSRACLEKLHRMCLLTAGVRALAVRKTMVSLTSTGLVTFREHVAAESLKAGDVVWFGGSKQEPAAYRYTNGSTLVVGGMDDPTKIMSSEYDICYVQEATELTEDDWEKITTRLRNGRTTFQQLLADCNPDAPTHWLLNRVNKGLTTMVNSRHEDNPVLFTDDGRLTERGAGYMATLDRLTGVRYQRLRHGKWVAAEGLIYEDYDPSIHVLDRFDVPDDWVRWWACDFGYTNPFVLQRWAEDGDGRLYLYREIYHTKKTVDEHARDILDDVSTVHPDIPPDAPVAVRYAPQNRVWREPKPRAIVCDHDAEGRVVLQRETGVGTMPAIKTVTAGIQVVQARLRPAGDGRPRLFLLRDAVVRRDPELEEARRPTCTIDEMPSYIWDQSAKLVPKENPLKDNDHGMDALRYLAAARDLGAPRLRMM